MIHIPVKISGPVSRDTVQEINRTVKQAVDARTVHTAGQTPGAASKPSPAGSSSRSVPNARTAPAASRPVPEPAAPPSAAATQPVPALQNPIQKGQKTTLASLSSRRLDVRLGWNVKNPACDVDVSAFLLDAGGKVPGDDWFVFYGQPDSPDRSVHFSCDCSMDREMISVDFSRLDPRVEKIVFVLTINDAFAKNLNFSMIQDAYIRILDSAAHQECVSFQMTDYYSNVISMMIGELYLYKGNWKFHAIGNGVARDLAGLCELYGVQVQ